MNQQQGKVTFYEAKYKGIQCITDKAYLFITSETTGVWIPKAMTFNLYIESNDAVTAVHPTHLTNVKEVILGDKPIKHETFSRSNPYSTARHTGY